MNSRIHALRTRSARSLADANTMSVPETAWSPTATPTTQTAATPQTPATSPTLPSVVATATVLPKNETATGTTTGTATGTTVKSVHETAYEQERNKRALISFGGGAALGTYGAMEYKKRQPRKSTLQYVAVGTAVTLGVGAVGYFAWEVIDPNPNPKEREQSALVKTGTDLWNLITK